MVSRQIKRKVKKQLTRLSVLIKAFIEDMINISNYISVLIILVTPYLFLLILESLSEVKLERGLVWSLPLVFNLVAFILLGVKGGKLNKIQKLPISSRRFTTKRADGEISVATSEIHEIIEYLSEVEDYIDLHGLRGKNDK